MTRLALIGAATAAILAAHGAAAPRAAHAFCGFYLDGAGGELFNDATQVVLMRMGTRTVLSMQNAYKGPPGEFAMVVPVPVVLQEGDVKTLPKEVFAKVDGMGAPRLVEYWERDPCEPDHDYDKSMMMVPSAAVAESGAGPGDKDYGVTIEAQFVVGEYQIVILSATDSTGLDRWLRDQRYAIPPGAEPLLRPYVEGGSKFFVAKVDPAKVAFDKEGRAMLSPLRFHYDHDELALPIRLGLANSAGKQDLIVSILSPEGRYHVTNYKNVTIPTNLDVTDEVRHRFAEFYAALFDRTLERNPGAVVTEYAWDASTCDPCPGPMLDGDDFATLGADVLAGAPGKPEPYQGWNFVLTRLHARYGKDEVPDDLVFGKAPPIVGGREHVVDHETGALEEGAREDHLNNFQGRYAIRHEWTGPIRCANPVRGRWGGPPRGERYAGPAAAKDLAFAPRGEVQLASMVRRDVPEVGLVASAATARRPYTNTGPDPRRKGCACRAGGDAGGALVGALALVGLAAVTRRRRR